nr:hypothetical protein [Tanacetum cinerariifolium]
MKKSQGRVVVVCGVKCVELLRLKKYSKRTKSDQNGTKTGSVVKPGKDFRELLPKRSFLIQSFKESRNVGFTKQEEKRIEEEQVAKAQTWKLFDDDDDEEISNSLNDNISELPPFSAITPDEPVLSTEEPDNSLSMGDEHLDTIPATESDKVIKSSVETLIPILNLDPEGDMLLFESFLNDDPSSKSQTKSSSTSLNSLLEETNN